MNKLFLIIALIVSGVAVAQEMAAGRMIDSNGVESKITFTRVNNETSLGYVTQYEIRNTRKELVYTIMATHEKSDNSIELAIGRDGLTRYSGIGIRRSEVGLYLNSDDLNDTTLSDPDKRYTLLLSFQDTGYTYPFINRITLSYYKDYLELDPLSSLLIKKHKQIVAGLQPQFDSIAYYKAQVERAEQERKQREQEEQERIKREQERQRQEADQLRHEEERKAQERRRNTYYSIYALQVADMRDASKAEALIEKEIDNYINQAECLEVKLSTSMAITVDTLGAVTRIQPLQAWDESNVKAEAIPVLKQIAERIRKLHFAITYVTIDGQAFPVSSKLIYQLAFESGIHVEKYHFDKANILLDKDDVAIKDPLRAEFFSIHGNKFAGNKFKVKFCSHHIGVYTADTMIEITDTENGPGGPRHVVYRKAQ